jgi:hypothetical protein
LISPKLGTQPLSHVSCTHAWAWPGAADLAMRWLAVLRLLGLAQLKLCLPAMHAASYCSAGTKMQRLCAAHCTLQCRRRCSGLAAQLGFRTGQKKRERRHWLVHVQYFPQSKRALRERVSKREGFWNVHICSYVLHQRVLYCTTV